MDIRDALIKGREKLKAKKISDIDLEAGLLLSFVLGRPREFLFSHPEHELTLIERIKYEFLLRKRLGHTPLAYLAKEKEFFGLSFFVNKNVLVPRPETELIVDEVLRIGKDLKNVSYIDVGTGSGCIIVTLAVRTEGVFWGLDISPQALNIAKKNALKHNVLNKIHFLRSNLLKELIDRKISGPIVIMANLPYLTPKQVENSPTIKKEPKLALIGGDDGLEYYHLLFKQIRAGRFSRPLFILCEIDETQVKKMTALIEKELPLASFSIKKDLKGLYRLAVIKLKAERSSRPNLKPRN